MQKKYNPNVKFMLENVVMKKEYQNVISQCLQVEPVQINSALVSAQNRERLYWANWGISQPQDREIYLKDILQPEHEVDEKYYINNENMLKFITDNERLRKKYTAINPDKSLTQTARQYASWNGTFVAEKLGYINKDSQGQRIYSVVRRLTPVECERLQTLPDNYTQGVSDSQRYKMLGNGWTRDVIEHNFNCLKNPVRKITEFQPDMFGFSDMGVKK